MKILFLYVTYKFVRSFGGAEKVVCQFANEFVRRGAETTIVYNELKSGPPAYPLNERVRLVNVNNTGAKFPKIPASLKFCREITRPFRRLIADPPRPLSLITSYRARKLSEKLGEILSDERPDVVVSFSPLDLASLLNRGKTPAVPIVQMFHEPPWLAFGANDPKAYSQLDRCAAAQVLLPSFAEYLRPYTTTRIAVVPNVVPQYSESVDADKTGDFRIVNVARFEKRQKRQRLLVEAFARIASEIPNWTLHFYGDDCNGYRADVRETARRLGLENRVFFHESTPKIKEEMLQADIFAFPSSFEAFGLAMAEAMSMKMPCVGYRSTPAVGELLSDSQGGLVVDDGVQPFADALQRLANDAELRKTLGANGKKFVERFEESRVWDAWERLLNDVVSDRRASRASDERRR